MKASAPARRMPVAPLADRYRALFDSVSDMVVLIAREGDGGYRCLDANAAVSRMEGIPLEAIIGKRVDAIHPPEVYAQWKEIYDKALETREPLDVDHEVPSPLGVRKRRTRFVALPPGEEGRELLLGVCQDLTDSLLARSEKEDFERYRESMNRLNAILDSDRAEEAMLQECVECLRAVFDADRCLMIFPCDPDAEHVAVPFCSERADLGLPPFPRALSIAGEPLRTFLARFMETQEPMDLGPEGLTGFGSDVLERHRIRSRLVIPIRPRTGKAWGLGVHHASERAWTAFEKRLLRDMAARIKPALDALQLTRTLRRSEEFHNLLNEMMPQLLWTLDGRGQVDFVNRRMRDYTGLDDLARIRAAEHVHPEDTASEHERIQECLKDGSVYEGEMRIRRRDGTYVWHLVRFAPLFNAEGMLDRVVGTCTDVSESKRLLEALARSKEEMEAIIGGVDEGISAQDPSGRIIYANKKYAEISGYESPEALLAAPLEERMARFRVFDEEGNPLPFERLPGRRALQGEAYASCILRFEDLARGSERWLHAKSTAVRDAEGKVTMAINFSQDITEARRAREELLRSREQMAAILAGIADAIVAQTPDGRLVYANEAAARQMGFPTAEGLIEAVNEAVEGRRSFGMEFFDEQGRPVPLEQVPSQLAHRGIATPPALLRFRTGPGAKERWVIAQAKPLLGKDGKVSLVLAMSQDVTELREKEETVRRLQKMESLGKLAGGIAHDFNNLLVSINGFSDLGARMAEGVDPVLREYFEEIRKSGERAAALTQQLLAYGRKQMVQPRVLDLNALVADMRKPLLPLIGEGIELKTALAEDSPPVKADAGQMEQVIMNLVLNARDAMPAGGVLALETALAAVGEGDPSGARPGRYAVLTVSDSGTGIDPAIRDRIFEPFFTTKKDGASASGRTGTGLGLASVYGIVDQSGGHIRVESEVGKGSVFRIFLPAWEESPPAAGTAPSADAPPRDRGGVLLVEDAESVSRFARHVLESGGFRVLAARSGAEALAAAAGAAALDLVVAEADLPDMPGSDLIRRLRDARPRLKALLMSGAPEPDDPAEPGRTEFLGKPFAPEELADRAARLLDAGAGAT